MSLERIRRVDRRILALAAGVSTFGLIFVASATANGADGSLQGHALRLGVAVLFGALCFLSPSRSLKRHAYLFYGVALLGLLAVLFVGRATNNARRWIDLPGGFKLQPSEFAKLGLLLALAKLACVRRRLETLEGLVVPVALALLPAGLVAVEPDLGTAIVFAPLLLGILYAGGARRSHLALLLALGLLAVPVGGRFAMRGYQRERIDAWWGQGRPSAEQKRGAGYHLFHSKVAVGAGGIAGQGIGAGTENRLDLLPERANDFVFAVVAEESGFLGGAALIGLYGALVLLLFGAATALREPFDRLLVTGVACLFGTHLFVNVGVAIGAVPTTGLTLPFVSYGGSSTVAAAGALGLALNALARREPELSEDAFA
ncbi:MAG: FtsW/RodA/SpoVE family cell cycle protein [Planctomycetota bacterium]